MTVDGHSLAAVIPAYRAAASITDLVQRIPEYTDWIIIVDDASPDDLYEVVCKIPNQRVILLRHESNQGVGGATVTGFKKALELGAELIAKVDADGQMDPQYLDRFVRMVTVHGCDYVKANRFGHFAALKSMPMARLIGNILLTFLTKMASGCWNVFDSQNGYVLITRKILCALNLDRIDRGYSFENSMLINLNIVRARIGEVYLPTRYGDEVSSMSLWRIVSTFPFYLFRGFLYRIYHKYLFRSLSPFALLFGFGLVAMAWGTVWGGYAWLQSFRSGVVATTGTIILALLPLLLGWSSLLQALVLDVQDAGPPTLYDYNDESLQTPPSIDEHNGRGMVLSRG
jgi:glycosyltransferase involved in cell wall biosynthesis